MTKIQELQRENAELKARIGQIVETYSQLVADLTQQVRELQAQAQRNMNRNLELVAELDATREDLANAREVGRKSVLSDLATLVPRLDAALDKQSILTCLSGWLEQAASADSEAISADFAEARKDTARLDWLQSFDLPITRASIDAAMEFERG